MHQWCKFFRRDVCFVEFSHPPKVSSRKPCDSGKLAPKIVRKSLDDLSSPRIACSLDENPRRIIEQTVFDRSRSARENIDRAYEKGALLGELVLDPQLRVVEQTFA